MTYYIVTHTDMDGIGSAALYIYLQGSDPRRIYFTEPYHIDRVVRKIVNIGSGKIAFMDLGMNPQFYPYVKASLEKLIGRGVEIEWYDHHVWNDEWVNGLMGIGVKLYVDRSTCATGVVAKHAPRKRGSIDQYFVEELVSGVCAGDLWRFDHWRGPWYLRLIRRREKDSWRIHVINVLSKGILWNQEFTENILVKLERELRAYNDVLRSLYVREVDGVRIVYIPSHDLVDTSFVAALALGRAYADVAVVVSRDGKLSFRSTGYNVREIAVRLGGGGHPRASGAKVKVPFKIRLLSHWRMEYLLNYVHGVIEKAILQDTTIRK